MDMNKIKKRLDALLAKARDDGASDAEVEAAMHAAQKLMSRYGISERDLEKVKSDDFMDVEYTPPPKQTRVDPVVRYCGGAVAKLCGLVGYSSGPHSITLHGLAPDVEHAKWLLNLLQVALADQWRRYKILAFSGPVSRATLMKERIGFIHGFCRGAVHKLRDLMSYQGDPEIEKSTALVVKKTDLALRNLEAKGIHLASCGASGLGPKARGSGSAQGAGYVAGNSVSFGNGIGPERAAITKQ